MKEIEEVNRMINVNTKLIWVETPTNPLLNIIDIEAMAMVAKNSNLMLCVCEYTRLFKLGFVS